MKLDDIINRQRKNRLPEIFAKSGMSLYELSRRADIPYNDAKRLVTSNRIPPRTRYLTLVKVSMALGIPIDQFEEKSINNELT